MCIRDSGKEVFSIAMLLGSDIVKADIMREPVAFQKVDPNVRPTPIEALANTLTFFGEVDMGYLTQTKLCIRDSSGTTEGPG